MIFTRTPLRVSLFGGGTDLKEYYEKYEGAVISTTINKFVYVIVKPNLMDDDIVLHYFDKEKVGSVDEIKHGIFREALKLTGVTKAVEILSFADLPLQGTGLGSSSAFTVGLLHALFAYQGKATDPYELAELASHIEIERLGEPIGKQDQYAAAFGGLREYIFCRDGKVKVEEVGLDSRGYEVLSEHMLLFHTGIERKASSVLSDQKSRMAQNVEHLHELRDLVQKSKQHLVKLEIDIVGQFLNTNWEQKKKLSAKIQNELIERMYNLGMQEGAYGGKLLGAGGGGYFCFLCAPRTREAIKAKFRDFKNLSFCLEPKGTSVSRL